jgi:hypothetical protein
MFGEPLEETSVEGPWVDGKPHGLCIFERKREMGILTFTHGKVHGGPGWTQDSDKRVTFESVINGEPSGIVKLYCSDDQSCILNDE